jgi:hypothetical protein
MHLVTLREDDKEKKILLPNNTGFQGKHTFPHDVSAIRIFPLFLPGSIIRHPAMGI